MDQISAGTLPDIGSRKMGPMSPAPTAGSKAPKHKIALHVIMIGMPAKTLGKSAGGKRSTK